MHDLTHQEIPTIMIYIDRKLGRLLCSLERKGYVFVLAS